MQLDQRVWQPVRRDQHARVAPREVRDAINATRTPVPTTILAAAPSSISAASFSTVDSTSISDGPTRHATASLAVSTAAAIATFDAPAAALAAITSAAIASIATVAAPTSLRYLHVHRHAWGADKHQPSRRTC